MKIEHIALWTSNIEELKKFYTDNFNAHSSPLYRNKIKDFKSCFLTFESGARLELMQKGGLSAKNRSTEAQQTGLIHLAISTGSRTAVDILTANLRRQGAAVTSLPRQTGDGYYESTVMDPDGNTIEITV